MYKPAEIILILCWLLFLLSFLYTFQENLIEIQISKNSDKIQMMKRQISLEWLIIECGKIFPCRRKWIQNPRIRYILKKSVSVREQVRTQNISYRIS